MNIERASLQDASISSSLTGDVEIRSLLRSILSISDHAILVTDLDHHPIACNRRFGEVFKVNSELVPSMQVEELRSYVYPRLTDPEAWRDQLERIYSTPQITHSDELELVDGDEIVQMLRVTGPLINDDGQIMGRVWTFRDITVDKIRQRRREALQGISTFHDPSPSKVCKRVTECLADVYGATAILSIWSGDRMLFREIARPPAWLGDVRANDVRDSYCQVAIRTVRPVIVQNAIADPELSLLLPARLGLTRYVGAPICNMNGEPVGTLCFLDGKTNIPVTEEDIEFVAILANRLATELERERLFEERSSAQRRDLERQRAELTRTQQVLDAMNKAFGLLGEPHGISSLLREQCALLRGLLDFNAAAIIYPGNNCYLIYAVRMGSNEVTEAQMSEQTARHIWETCPPGFGSLKTCEIDMPIIREWTKSKYGVISRLSEDAERPPLLLFATPGRLDESNQHLMTHLTALVDQVALLILAHRLQNEIRNARTKLIETEKLSVVGTLAASIAHDIRNILSTIGLEIAMCSNPVDTLKSVQQHIDRFSLLSHRLLSYVKPRFLAREDIRLNEIIDRANGMLASQARVSGVRLTTNLDSCFPVIIGDPHRLEHLIVNIMLNALQAMNSTGGELLVKTAAGEDWSTMEIADNGRGIALEVQSSIFEPFMSSREDGFGLGLFSCRQIAEEHGWSLTLDSEVGRGTTFTLAIPKESYS